MTNVMVFILTEGTEKTGLGHIGRCLSIFQAFNERGITPRFIVNGGAAAAQLLIGKPHEIFDWLADTYRLSSLLKSSDIVIVDSYLAPREHYNLVSQLVQSPVFLDDNIRLNYPKGIVVNGTMFAERLPYPQNPSVDYHLGSAYILLRQDFWQIPQHKTNDNVQDVLISFGGSDIRNLTPVILQRICQTKPTWTKHVVIGPGSGNLEVIKKVSDQETIFYQGLSATEMKELMLKCDLAISAAGQTINELARCGLPTIAFQVIDNQTENVKGWTQAGFLAAAFNHESFSLKELDSAISELENKELRMRLTSIGQKCVDGKGASRLFSAAMGALITLNQATSNDLMPLFYLANDPVVRANSFSTEEIKLSEHTAWFNRILQSKDTLLVLARIQDEPLGQVRFDRKEEGVVTSISISSDFRGWGLGDILLRKALSYVKSHWPETSLVIAYVKSTNIASQRIFEKAGYQLTEDEKGTLKYIYHYV
ncbi:MAG: bifunctional UDP-2,4-diacetamido-2,4,6-trideoxy-beta-L-altropyranose hydrolase/GNAT family N-acetyltransferase [Bacteroidota bacterium]|nr:bifunctional UDP-2,4-diacetamido-2,4,6-trideoxy-beta-L-altropyranose hydrolase/GNAT family N-acetyltransferase [Bacteroidota bacterium]